MRRAVDISTSLLRIDWLAGALTYTRSAGNVIDTEMLPCSSDLSHHRVSASARIGLQGRGQIDLLLAFHAYPHEVPLGFQLLPNVIGLIRNGYARALAVASSKRMTARLNSRRLARLGRPARVAASQS